MGQFGTFEIAGASGTLGSDATKRTPTPSETAQLATTIVITPAADEVVEITQVDLEVNVNSTLSVNIISEASYQSPGKAETAKDAIATSGFGVRTGCTTELNYAAASEAESLKFRGDVGQPVTVRFYLRTSNAAATSGMCSRNHVVIGRLVKVVNQKMGGQFRPAF